MDRLVAQKHGNAHATDLVAHKQTPAFWQVRFQPVNRWYTASIQSVKVKKYKCSRDDHVLMKNFNHCACKN